MAAVRSLGYAVVNATDLNAWKEFAVDLLGLQIAEQTPDRLLLRMDHKAYRLDVRRSESTDNVSALGWEVGGPAELAEIVGRLEKSGYSMVHEDASMLKERQVSGLVSFDDPDGQHIELFYGLMTDKTNFASPLGVTFVTGGGGLGHAFQLVEDNAAYNELYFDILGFRLSDYIEFGEGYGTFTHVNSRHHSFAWAPFPNAPRGVGHLMFEVTDVDYVGRAWDKVQDGAAPIAMTFGKHSNDEMLSFYVRSPSGFQIEYGYGGKIVDPATWTPDRHPVASLWGHKRTDPNEPEI